MPLIKCPDCNQDVSDRARSCPNCGYPITATGTEGESGDSSRCSELVRIQKVLVYLVILAGIALLIPSFAAESNSLTMILAGVLIGLAIIWMIVLFFQKRCKNKA